MKTYRGLQAGTKGDKPNEDFVFEVAEDNFRLWVLTDGYWGTGVKVSKLAPVLFHREVSNQFRSGNLTPSNARGFLQPVVDRVNEQLIEDHPGCFTTMTAALEYEDNVYCFTLGDSVGFGLPRGKGNLELLVEPQTKPYQGLKQHEGNKIRAFKSYCVLDTGRDAPLNYLGLPDADHPEATPTIHDVSVVPVDSLDGFLLCTDGLTARVMPSELEKTMREEEPENVVSRLLELKNNPEEMIYHLINQAYASGKPELVNVRGDLKKVIQEQGINPEQEASKVYQELREDPVKFQAVAEFCLTYEYKGKPRKPMDDTAILYVDLHPDKKPRRYDLQARIGELEAEVREREGRIDRLEGQVEETLQSLGSQTETTQARDGTIAGLRGDLETAGQEYKTLEQTLAGERQRISRLQGEVRTLDGTVQRVTVERDRLRGQLQDANKLNEGSGREYETLRADYERATSIIGTLQAEMRDLQAQMVGAEQRREDAEARERDAEARFATYREEQQRDVVGEIPYGYSFLDRGLQRFGNWVKKPRRKRKELGLAAIGAVLAFGTFVLFNGAEYFHGQMLETTYLQSKAENDIKIASLTTKQRDGISSVADAGDVTAETEVDDQVVIKQPEQQPQQPVYEPLETDDYITVCVTNDGNFGYVSIIGTNALRKKENRQERTKKVTCRDDQRYRVSTDLGLNLYYMNGAASVLRNQEGEMLDWFVLGSAINPVTINHVVQPNVQNILFCDYRPQWREGNGTLHLEKGCDHLASFNSYHRQAGTFQEMKDGELKRIRVAAKDELRIRR